MLYKVNIKGNKGVNTNRQVLIIIGTRYFTQILISVYNPTFEDAHKEKCGLINS